MKHSETGLDPTQQRGRYLAASAAHAETDEHPAVITPSLWRRVCAWAHRIRVRRALRRQYRDECRRLLHRRQVEELISSSHSDRCRDINNLLAE